MVEQFRQCHTPRPRGHIWPQDRWGRVLNAAVDRQQIGSSATAMVRRAHDLGRRRFGNGLHSIYLSGQAARGRPGDAHIIFLLKAGQSSPDSRAWQTLIELELQRDYGQIDLISVSVQPWNSVFSERGGLSETSFCMSVNSLCMAGTDMSRLIPPQRLGDTTGNGEIVSFRSRMSHSVNHIARARSVTGLRISAMRAGRSILSAAFATVMAREQIYTEDSDLQRDYFVLWHPDRASGVEAIFRLATAPGSDRSHILQLIESACHWMMPLTENWLNAHNPGRVKSLLA